MFFLAGGAYVLTFDFLPNFHSSEFDVYLVIHDDRLKEGIALREMVICLTLYFLGTQMNYETIL